MKSRIVLTIGKAAAILATTAMLTCPAAAVGYGTVRLFQITYSNHFFFFKLANSDTARAPCATSDRYVVDVNTEAGRAIAAAVMTAHAQGRQVAAHGEGVCNLWPDAETISWIDVYEEQIP